MPPIPTDAQEPDLDAVIVGAGFSGLYMLYRLRDVLGLSARVYEAGDGVGGTWYWNRYPGARCDSESYYYSYSFSEELQQEWVWSSKYPEQPEILRYLNHVADRFDLRRDITLGTRVTSAVFLDDRDCWEIRTDHDEVVTARFFVSAVGCLSAANVPPIPGLERFEGAWYHTGAWPHEGVDFSGKRVGLIGTGSTGIQATPVIAAQAAHLTVFQRTPNYTVPARNFALTAEYLREIKANYGEIRRKARRSFGGFPYDPSDKSAIDVSPEERQATYERLWAEEGGFKFIYGSYNDLLSNQQSNDTAAEFIRSKIRETVKDPIVAETLAPKGYPYGTKRPPIDTHYFETFNRDNVSLVDLRETPIAEITPTGLRTTGADYDLDIIVFATGFDAMTGSLLKIDIRGRAGEHAEAEVGGWTGDLSRRASGRLPEHVRRHRSRQSLRPDQHAVGHRAACRVDRRLYLPPPQGRPDPRGSHRGGRAGLGRACQRGGGGHLVHADRLLVCRGEHPGEEAGLHALRRRLRAIPPTVR